MKEININERFISDDDFIQSYYIKHKKMQSKFGKKIISLLTKHKLYEGHILDAGCAFGETLITIGKKLNRLKLTGIDISEKFLMIARKNAEKDINPYQIVFQNADVLNMPFENESFDFVFNINMLHVVSEPIKMLNEIQRVLKKDGILFISDLRKSFLGLFEKEINRSYKINDLNKIVNLSILPKGKITHNLLWWQYETDKYIQ